MKRFLLPLVALSIAFTSCSRDNDDVINNPITNPITQGDLLAEITEEGNAHYRFNTYFTYDGEKLQSSHGIEGSTGYSYDGEKISRSRRERGYFGTWETRYIYNPNGTLKTAVETYTRQTRYIDSNTQEEGIINHKTETSREYTYAGNMVKVKQTSQYSDDSDRTPEQESTITNHTFTLDNGNIIKRETEVYSGTIETVTYTYDNKVNPLSKIKGLAALNVEFRVIDAVTQLGTQEVYANKNNITLIKTTLKDSYNTLRDTQESNVYEYNSKGYPTKKTNTSEGYTNIYTYKYK